LKDLLENHPNGRLVLAVHEREGKLSKQARQLLVELIIHKLMQNYDE
jgi:hypothetical protein